MNHEYITKCAQTIDSEPRHKQRDGAPLTYSCNNEWSSFLSRVSVLTRDIDIANLSVRLSVCLSVRPKRSGIR